MLAHSCPTVQFRLEFSFSFIVPLVDIASLCKFAAINRSQQRSAEVKCKTNPNRTETSLQRAAHQTKSVTTTTKTTVAAAETKRKRRRRVHAKWPGAIGPPRQWIVDVHHVA